MVLQFRKGQYCTEVHIFKYSKATRFLLALYLFDPRFSRVLYFKYNTFIYLICSSQWKLLSTDQEDWRLTSDLCCSCSQAHRLFSPDQMMDVAKPQNQWDKVQPIFIVCLTSSGHCSLVRQTFPILVSCGPPAKVSNSVWMGLEPIHSRLLNSPCTHT